MPVWHEAAKEFVAAGRLRLVGLTQEQHPDRCRLYAQWRGFDFPILWDPFNLTRSTAVPIIMGVDSSGVLRSTRLNARQPRESLEAFLAGEWPAVVEQPAHPYPTVTLAASRKSTHPRDPNSAAQYGMARLLFHSVDKGTPPGADVFAEALLKIGGYAKMEGSSAEARFHLGVAHRLRYDSVHRQGTDFQASLDAWMAALMENPGQYIWRRRIQQWGPRLDKPYPFYDWIEQALTDVRARGEQPVRVQVPLTGSEVAGATKEIPTLEHEDVHPDPAGKLPRDSRGRIVLDTAAALHTGITSQRVREPAGTARIHLVFRPDPKRDVHWGNEAGPTQVWIDVPEGWNVRRHLWTLPLPEEVSTNEVRTLDFEVRPPLGPPAPATISGVAFYPVCDGVSGECTLLARDFTIPIPLPTPREDDEG